ncbi:hypothetical protein MNV49_002175 [Pseudohyphozyma bogoriensis]|nr:hypothetical protein MNV49_002175 [Pseudohyphozyma bogoriensis]
MHIYTTAIPDSLDKFSKVFTLNLIILSLPPLLRRRLTLSHLRSAIRSSTFTGLALSLYSALLKRFSPLLATPALALLPEGGLKDALPWYVVTRAGQAAYDGAKIKGTLPGVLEWLSEKQLFGGYLLFSLSNALLLHTTVHAPDHAPKGSTAFILSHSAAYIPSTRKAETTMDLLRPLTLPPDPYPLSKSGVSWKKLLRTPPVDSLKSIALNTGTSALFLSLCINVAWAQICLYQRILPPNFLTTSRWYFQVFWELYHPFFLRGGGKDGKGLKRRKKVAELLMMGMGMEVLLGVYKENKDAVRSGFVRRALEWIGGNEGKGAKVGSDGEVSSSERHI